MRFLNFSIDIIFLRILRGIIYFLSGFIPLNRDFNSLLDWFKSLDRMQNYLFFTLLLFLYYSLFEMISSRTLAKYFTKTIVVKEDGSKPNPLDILGRTLIRLIPFEYFTFLQGRELGWHDDYSKTYVVKKDKLEKWFSDFNGC